MESITKRRLAGNQLERAARHAFGDGAVVEAFDELKEGYFNAAYLMDIRGTGRVVLKVAPPPEVRVMAYEEDLMRAEATALRLMASGSGAPVPRVLCHCDDASVLGSPFLFLECLDGMPFHKAQDAMPDDAKSAVYRAVGGHLASINSIKGDWFGSIAVPAKRYGTWGEAFLSMTVDLVADAVDAGVDLPLPGEGFIAMVRDNTAILDSVSVPALVHKDMWQGNVFVDPGVPAVTGIIDCERALFGDPLMDFVFGFLEQNADFNGGYGREPVSSRDDLVRKRLYEINLDLILIIECAYRKYPTDDQEKWARGMLDGHLADLSALTAQ